MKSVSRARKPAWTRRIVRTFASAALVLALAGVSHAAIPQEFSYQAYLTDATGLPVTSSNVDVTITFHDAVSGGNQLGAPIVFTGLDLAATRGFINVNVSTAGLAPEDLNGDLYLEITIDDGGGAETLSPRQKVVAAPTALNADLLDGLDSSDFVTTGTVQTISGSKTFTDEQEVLVTGVSTSASGETGAGLSIRTASDANAWRAIATRSRMLQLGTSEPAGAPPAPLTSRQIQGFVGAVSAEGGSNTDVGAGYFNAKLLSTSTTGAQTLTGVSADAEVESGATLTPTQLLIGGRFGATTTDAGSASGVGAIGTALGTGGHTGSATGLLGVGAASASSNTGVVGAANVDPTTLPLLLAPNLSAAGIGVYAFNNTPGGVALLADDGGTGGLALEVQGDSVFTGEQDIDNTVASPGGDTTTTRVDTTVTDMQTNSVNTIYASASATGVLPSATPGDSSVRSILSEAYSDGQYAAGVSASAFYTGNNLFPNAAFLPQAIGVNGFGLPDPGGLGPGVKFSAIGVSGSATESHEGSNLGVLGWASGSDLRNIGVDGVANADVTEVTSLADSLPNGFAAGVFAYNPDATANDWALWAEGKTNLNGDVTATGDISATGDVSVTGAVSVTGKVTQTDLSPSDPGDLVPKDYVDSAFANFTQTIWVIPSGAATTPTGTIDNPYDDVLAAYAAAKAFAPDFHDRVAVILTPGRHTFSSTLVMDEVGIDLVGFGERSSTLQGTADPAIQMTAGTSGAVIRNLNLNGDPSGSNVIVEAQGGRLENVAFRRPGGGPAGVLLDLNVGAAQSMSINNFEMYGDVNISSYGGQTVFSDGFIQGNVTSTGSSTAQELLAFRNISAIGGISFSPGGLFGLLAMTNVDLVTTIGYAGNTVFIASDTNFRTAAGAVLALPDPATGSSVKNSVGDVTGWTSVAASSTGNVPTAYVAFIAK